MCAGCWATGGLEAEEKEEPMATQEGTPDLAIRGMRDKVTLLLIAGLLLLRLPFLAGLTYLLKPAPYWLGSWFEIGTYLLTVVLIWWERDRLTEFHIDRLALVIIILFKPIETIIRAFWGNDESGLAFPKLPGLAFWVIAVGLFVMLRLGRPKLSKIRALDLRWFVIGALVGVAVAILLGYPMSLQIDDSSLTTAPELFPIIFMVVLSFVYQLGYAAVTEEPLFRGFLWGYLRRMGWKETWIWLFQAGLFCLGHIYYLGKSPISFWVIVPTGALVMGFLAWRSRSIATSMAAHGAMNALGYTVGYVIAFFRFGS